MCNRTAWSCVGALMLLGAAARAQEPGVSIRTSVREVVVDVVVHDRHGKLVRTLTPQDVTLFEDGVQQQVRSLRLVSGREVRQQETPAPSGTAESAPVKPVRAPALSPLRTVNLVCLVFHDLSPETRKMAFDSALEFLDAELRPNTLMGIFSLDDRGLHLMTSFTGDRAALVTAIQRAAAGQIHEVAAVRQVFAGLNVGQLTITPQGLAPQAFAAAQGSPTSQGQSSVDLLKTLGAPMDASMAVGESADIAKSAMGRQTINEQRVVAVRELQALGWLVAQLGKLPFRKTVFLLSPGIAKPAPEHDYWQKILRAANESSISFYALEVTGPTPVSPLTASRASAGRAASLSQRQSQPTPTDGNGLRDLMDRAQESEVADFAVETANTHAALVDLAESTGGFLITSGAKRMLSRIMDDAQTHFELTYTPPSEVYDGRYHRIEVKLARQDLRADARNGYFAVPGSADGGVQSNAELGGLRALNTTPRPREFEYRAAALRFASPAGAARYAIAFDVPVANLAPRAVAEKLSRAHASLLALVKDAQGNVIDQWSSDAPVDVASGAASRILLEHPLPLGPGSYTVETAVVDWEGGRASTGSMRIECAASKGLELSSVALVGRVEEEKGAQGADPMDYQGKRMLPALDTALPQGAKPFVFFRVSPEAGNAAKPVLRAQFVVDGRVVADQTAALPAPDASGSIPVVIQPAAMPGSDEMRLTVTQGAVSASGEIHYTVPAKVQ